MYLLLHVLIACGKEARFLMRSCASIIANRNYITIRNYNKSSESCKG